MALSTDSAGFSDALVILGAAGLVIPLFTRFRITPIIGFILVGVLVGPHGLGSLVGQFPWLYYVTLSDPESIEPFAELGIILLLFSVGLELSFKRLWSMRRLVFGLGAAELFGSAALLGTALYLFSGQTVAGSAGLGLALALSSTALVLPMVGTTGPVGRSAFGMLLFEDVALVPIVFILGALAPRAADSGFGELAQTIGIGVATIIAMMILGRFLLPRLFAQAARTKSPELFLSASLLVVILASLATTAAGLSPIVGALVAGLLIAETDYHSEVESMISPLKGLALGVFLITVGMTLDLVVIAENGPALALAVVGVVAIKSLVTAFFLRASGARRSTSAETALLMASPSETTLIVLAAAAAAGLISIQTAAFWQIVTAIGLTITPILARVGHDMARRIELRGHDMAKPQLDVEEGSPRALVVGFGRVGKLIADMLQRHNVPYVAVESNVDAVAEGRREGYPVVFGDIARPETLEKLQVDRATALILTMDEPVLAARVVKRVRAAFPDLTIIARARDANHAAELYRAGASDAVPETLESSLQLSEAVLVDLGIPMGPVIASIHEKRDEFRRIIKDAGGLDHEPKLKLTT